jgi:hypothetical protein
MEDPQTRQYAVLSIGRILLGRAGSRNGESTKLVDCEDSDVAPSGENLDSIVNALSTAMQDYALDRRGDVGSWVREVCIEVIAALLLAQVQGAHASSPRVPKLSSDEVTTKLVGMMLKQAVEKIDRLRERAFSLLYAVLCQRSGSPASLIEHAYGRICHGETYDLFGDSSTADSSGVLSAPKDLEILMAALREAAPAVVVPSSLASEATSHSATENLGSCETNAVGSGAEGASQAVSHVELRSPGLVDRAAASSAIFDAIVPLMDTEAYRPAVALGLVVSMGGLTESTALEAKRALLKYLHAENQDCTRRVRDACNELLGIFDNVSTADGNAEAKRVLGPLFSTIGKLLAEGIVPDDFFPSLYDKAFAAMRKSRDMGRLTSSVSVFVGLLRRPGDIRRKSMSALLLLLGFSYPTVRQATAKALYIRLLEEDGDFDLSAGDVQNIVPSDAIAAVSELISLTPWGTSSDDVLKTALREVYDRLGLDIPTGGRSIVCPKAERGKSSKAGGQYADLVREEHF